jgi:hypothetical protein
VTIAIAIVIGVCAVVGLPRVLAPASQRALGRARAGLAIGAIAIWAALLSVLADRFAERFSDRDLSALLWAAIGVALAIWLALIIEPLARAIAALRPRR